MFENISIIGVTPDAPFKFLVGSSDRLKTKSVTVENEGEGLLNVNGAEVDAGELAELDGADGVIEITGNSVVRVTVHYDVVNGE